VRLEFQKLELQPDELLSVDLLLQLLIVGVAALCQRMLGDFRRQDWVIDIEHVSVGDLAFAVAAAFRAHVGRSPSVRAALYGESDDVRLSCLKGVMFQII
jgi:hypothetical protein